MKSGWCNLRHKCNTNPSSHGLSVELLNIEILLVDVDSNFILVHLYSNIKFSISHKVSVYNFLVFRQKLVPQQQFPKWRRKTMFMLLTQTSHDVFCQQTLYRETNWLYNMHIITCAHYSVYVIAHSCCHKHKTACLGVVANVKRCVGKVSPFIYLL